MSAQGLLIGNLLSGNRGISASAKRIHTAFEQRSVVFPSLDSGNAIAFGACGDEVDVSLEEMRARANGLRQQTGLDLRPTITRLQLVQSLPKGRLRL